MQKRVNQERILKKTRERMEKEKTMHLSIKEGSAASVMTGLGSDYITPYALALNANNAQIGFLSSFTNLLAPFSQIAGSKMMEKNSRKKLILTFVSLQALMWLPIILLSLFFWKNLFTANLPVILIVFYSLFAIFGSIAGPAWFSLMGDIIPEKIRGRYLSKRNKICGAVALISTLFAAFILDFFKTKGFLLLGFAVIFLIASIARLISAFLFSKHYYPKLKLEKEYYFSFWQFIKKAPKNNFGKFTFFVAFLQLATAIAGPFFSVYMLKNLNFSYTTFMFANISTAITTLVLMPFFGKFSDKYGNRELMRIGGALIPAVPFLWLLSSSPLYIIFVPQVLAGISWGAFNFAASNFIYDSVSPQRRGICVAYYNVLAGIFIFLGASLGGLIAQYLSISFMNILLFLFLISGIARCLVYIIFMPKIKEVRIVKKPRYNLLILTKEISSARDGLYSVFHNIFYHKKFNLTRKN